MTPTIADLLQRPRDADPSARIDLRDPIAAYGEAAIDAMSDWVGDPRLGALAVRVLQAIAKDPAHRVAVVDVLVSVDRQSLDPKVVSDIERTLETLGWSRSRSGTVRKVAAGLPVGRPGVSGRGYWVMRTSPWERPFVWAEALEGRLRQGWGSTEEQNLEVIARVRRQGGPLNEDQEYSVRSRRMNTAEPDGMRFDDVVVAPNLPEWGRLSVFRVIGSYGYSMLALHRWGERFGHTLPVELIEGHIGRRSPRIPDELRAMLRPQSRLYNISGYGGYVERLLGNEPRPGRRGSDRWGELWTEREYEVLFGRFPPTGTRPTDDRIALLAAELGRTFDAVSWQWDDGASYCTGGPAATASEPLKAWLDRTFPGYPHA